MLLELSILTGFFLLIVIGFISLRRNRHRGAGAMGNALQEVHSAMNPGMKHNVIEQRRAHRREDDSGEPPLE
jgi:hypothetical protein